MGILRNAFLSVALATTLAGGISQSAFAQTQPGPPPQPDAQTETVHQTKPWANDPGYKSKVQAYEESMRLKVETYNEQMQLRIRQEDQQHASAMAQMASRYPKNGDWRAMMNYGAQVNRLNSNHELRHNSLVQQERTFMSQQEQAHINFIQTLDTQMGRLPQYANSGVSTTQPTVKAPTVKNTPAVKSPAEKAHDDAVNRYNTDYRTAQVAISRGNTKVQLPDPTSAAYGLDKEDPGLTPNLMKQFQKAPSTQPAPKAP